MTRKDYKIIAAAIKATRDNNRTTDEGRDALAFLVGYLGTDLLRDNPRFDYAKFHAASGLSDR